MWLSFCANGRLCETINESGKGRLDKYLDKNMWRESGRSTDNYAFNYRQAGGNADGQRNTQKGRHIGKKIIYIYAYDCIHKQRGN